MVGEEGEGLAAVVAVAGAPELGLCPALEEVVGEERRCGIRGEGNRSERGAAGSRFGMGVLGWRGGI